MRDLSVRGRCFLAAGVVAIICGVQVGERDFVRIGLVIALVPLLDWLLLGRGKRVLWVRRGVANLRVEAGQTAQIEVVVGNAGRRTRLLFLEEELSPALGEHQLFTVDPLAPGEQTAVRYLVRTEQRGRYRLGPMHVGEADPIGMIDLDKSLSSTASILVTPRTEPLPQIALAGRWAGAGENRTRDLLGGGSPDVTIREYRLGDDLRRIHWPTSARVDELMVRREEQQWQSRCTLLLDNRRSSHRGQGVDSTLEVAVSAAASIMANLVALDFEVRLVTAAGESSAHGWHQGSRAPTLAEQLERLALIDTTPQEQLSTGWIDETQHGGMLLAVLGDLRDADRGFVGGLARAGDSAYAVVVDVAQWEGPGRGGATATAALRSHGWKATSLDRGGSLAASWLELSR